MVSFNVKYQRLQARAEQMLRDIEFLLSMIETLEEATGEGPEGDDAIMLAQMRASYSALGDGVKLMKRAELRQDGRS